MDIGADATLKTKQLPIKKMVNYEFLTVSRDKTMLGLNRKRFLENVIPN